MFSHLTRSRWLPVVAWAGVIFAFSSVPSLSTHLGVWDLLLRKLAHLTCLAFVRRWNYARD